MEPDLDEKELENELNVLRTLSINVQDKLKKLKEKNKKKLQKEKRDIIKEKYFNGRNFMVYTPNTHSEVLDSVKNDGFFTPLHI